MYLCIQSLRAFRRPFPIAKWYRWVVGSKGRWVGGSRGRGNSRKQNCKQRGRKRCENEHQKGPRSDFGVPKGLLFESWGALGGHFGHPGGHFGHPGGHIGHPGGHFEHPGGHCGHPGAHQGTLGEPKHSKSAIRYCKNRCWRFSCFFVFQKNITKNENTKNTIVDFSNTS